MTEKTRWTIRPPWKESAEGDFFLSYDQACQINGEFVTEGKQNHVHTFKPANTTYYVKRYFRSLGFGSWLGLSRSELEARNQLWFEHMGFPCAKIVAYGFKKKNGRTSEGIIITEGVENTLDLFHTAKNNPDLFACRAWRLAIFDQLADITRKMHKHRFCHNDFQWRNILVLQEKSTPELFLIDCPSGKHFFPPLLGYRIIKDLVSLDEKAQVYLSKTERLRFYLRYKQKTRMDKNDKKIIRKILTRYQGR